MKTLISILIVAVFAFFFANCNETSSILTSPGQNITDGNKEITFTGTGDGETTAPNGMNYPQRHFVGTGTSSLTNGECTIVLDYWALPNGTSMLGTGKLIAANGNELHAINIAGTWTISETTISFTCSGNLAGGTGQFTNALGTMTITGTMDAVTRVTNAEWTGTLRHAKPFSGTLSGVNGTITNPGCASGFVRRHTDATANITHFGASTAIIEHCFSFTTFLVTNGEGTVTGDDGDKMYFTYNGFATPIPGTQNANVTLLVKITGGTGKFINASGYFTGDCVQNYISGEATGTVKGAIDY